MAGFIKKHKKRLKLLLLLMFISISFFLISYFSKNTGALAVKYSLQQCEINTGYSIAYDVEAGYHKDKTISHVSVEGAKEENDNTYRRKNEEVTIYHILDTDINSILGSENRIGYDTWNKEVFSADFKGEEIGRGAIFIEVSYWDDFGFVQTETVHYTDIFNGAVKGDKKELIKIEKECDVRILLVYEVIDKYGTSSEDFRVNYLFKIRNGSNIVSPKTIGPAKNLANEIPAQVPEGTDILKGSTVFNGFWLNFNGNQFYTAEVYRNGNLEGIYDYITIRIRGSFTDEGVYRIVSKNAFGEEDEFYITVDRYKPAGKFMNIDLDGNNTFTNFTAFILDRPLGGFDNRSPVTMKISRNGGEYAEYSSGEIIKETGYYTIWLKNDLYANIIYNFTIIETIIPNYNHIRLNSFQESLMPARYYGVDLSLDEETTTYCFADYDKALEKAKMIEWDYYVRPLEIGETLYDYRGESYSFEELTLEIINYARQNVNLRYTDISAEGELVFAEGKLVFDEEMFDSHEIPYLNGFTFTSKSPVFSDTVYYLRLEDYPKINEFDEDTALSIAKASKNVLKYDSSVDEQLTLSGTYLILDINIYGQIYAFKAYFVKENNGKIKIDYAVNQNEMRTEVTVNENELPAIVDYFKIGYMNDIYDIYTIVKVVYNGQADYYTAKDIGEGKSKRYYSNGDYYVVCYDRNGNYFKFEITIENIFPDGGIRFEGVENDGIAYDNFKIYFNINLVSLEIVENGTTILLIEETKVRVNINALELVYEGTEGVLFIEKTNHSHKYKIYFTGMDDDAPKEYNVFLV